MLLTVSNQEEAIVQQLTQKYNFNGAKVDLDVVYFTTLMNNLLSNAVKYSDKEPVIDIEGFTTENNISYKYC